MKYWPQFQELWPSKIFLKDELRHQIAKDLGISPDEVPEEDLLAWLSDWLNDHFSEIDLAQLIYRIDLGITSAERPEELAQAILEREAQKVIFRAQYSGKI